MKEVEKDFEELQSELTELEKEREKYKKEGEIHEGDLFLYTTEEFSQKTEISFKSQKKFLDKMTNKFKTILEYFGEETSNMSTDEFFGNFSNFLTYFQVCLEQLV